MAINHPGRMSDQNEAIERARDRAEMDVRKSQLESAVASLAAIFDGIGRGDQVDLVFPDGEIVTITRARPRKSQEG